jgi:hypothetical protein
MSDDHGRKSVTLVVNTRSFEWVEKEISYEQVYDLAYPGQPLAEGDSATVTYSRGPHGNGGGSLTPGHSVNIKDGMVFNVYRTSRS